VVLDCGRDFFFLGDDGPSLNMMGNRVYSVNAFRISRLGMGPGAEWFSPC